VDGWEQLDSRNAIRKRILKDRLVFEHNVEYFRYQKVPVVRLFHS